jgi:hypothetical protein
MINKHNEDKIDQNLLKIDQKIEDLLNFKEQINQLNENMNFKYDKISSVLEKH